ncbi:MAG: molybdenum cofactor guanylyltransferase [Cyanobacteria bacterium P01_A01_bin.114]
MPEPRSNPACSNPASSTKTASPSTQPEVTSAALILAGGRSTRMGQDKALLTLAGKPLLLRTCETALACTPQTFVITPWPQRYQAAVPGTVKILTEPLTDCPRGPLSGFAQGLQQLNQRQIKADWILLLACDLPCLDRSVLQHWQTQLADVSAGAIAALPRSPKGWEPLCGYYRRSVLASLEETLQQGNDAFQRWLSTQAVAPLMAPPQMLTNCNTPQQWQDTLQSLKASPV